MAKKSGAKFCNDNDFYEYIWDPYSVKIDFI